LKHGMSAGLRNKRLKHEVDSVFFQRIYRLGNSRVMAVSKVLPQRWQHVKVTLTKINRKKITLTVEDLKRLAE